MLLIWLQELRRKDKIEKPFCGGGCTKATAPSSMFNHPSKMIDTSTLAFKNVERTARTEEGAGRPKWRPSSPQKKVRRCPNASWFPAAFLTLALTA